MAVAQDNRHAGVSYSIVVAHDPAQSAPGVLRPGIDIACEDSFSRAVLLLVRFVGAAYATGVSDCWEAAYGAADEVTDVPDGPLLVARVVALVRSLQHNCGRELVYMPAGCNRVSADERRLMSCLRLARHGRLTELRTPLSGLVNIDREAVVLRALIALAALSTQAQNTPAAIQ